MEERVKDVESSGTSRSILSRTFKTVLLIVHRTINSLRGDYNTVYVGVKKLNGFQYKMVRSSLKFGSVGCASRLKINETIKQNIVSEYSNIGGSLGVRNTK